MKSTHSTPSDIYSYIIKQYYVQISKVKSSGSGKSKVQSKQY